MNSDFIEDLTGYIAHLKVQARPIHKSAAQYIKEKFDLNIDEEKLTQALETTYSPIFSQSHLLMYAMGHMQNVLNMYKKMFDIQTESPEKFENLANHNPQPRQFNMNDDSLNL